MRLIASIVFASLACAGQAVAAEITVDGVYLQSEELCAQAKADSLQTVIEAGNVLLTNRGLESIEYNCEFVSVIRAERSATWLVNAVCQEPGYLFPDLLSITETSPTQIDIASVRSPDPEGGGGGNSGSYFLCEGVEGP